MSKEIIAPRRTADPCPLSFAQRRLWFLNQLAPEIPNNIVWTLKANGKLNVEALQQALDEIVARHEIFRTTFESADGEPVQVIAPDGSAKLIRIDLGGLAGMKIDSEIRRLV